jgi:hypothetical protein
MATAVDEHGEGSNEQRFLPVSEEQAATENSNIPEFVTRQDMGN